MPTDYRIAIINSNTDKLSTYLWNGATAWALVGNELTIASLTNPCIAYLGKNKMALSDSAANILRAYYWDNINWTVYGQTTTLASFGFPSLATIYPNRVAFIADTFNKIRAFEFNKNGLYFGMVGNDFTATGTTVPCICGMNINEIAFIEQTNRLLKRMKLIGNVWTQIGSSLSITGGTNISITALTKNRIAYIDDTNRSLRVYDWNETTLTWSLLASGLSIPTITQPTIDAIDFNKIAFFDTFIKELRTYTLSGTTWSQTGAGLSIPTATINPNIAAFYKPFTTKCINEIPLDGNEIWPMSDY